MTKFDQYIKFIEESDVKFIDLRFTDTKGKEHHVTVPAKTIDEDFFEDGKMFDGSSINGWKGINESDMILMPDVNTMFFDPFFESKTVIIRCDILDPITMMAYERDPRSIAKKAELYLQACGVGDTAFLGPEPEFFVFDSVTYKSDMEGSEYKINAENAAWSSNEQYEHGNRGHRPGIKGGYFPVPPVDSLHEVRSDICSVLDDIGQEVEVHHHEVATAGQCEVGTKFSTLTDKADQVQQLKYVVHNVADMHGKTATFMPKPIPGDNGSGMHVHISIAKDGQNLFAGDEYGRLSETALYFIGGIIKHAKAINAFSNPSTNSYKRLVPGFEAPVLLAYSARNRSASIRIPFVSSDKARRIEIRFGDPMANPYLMFSAYLMAGLDGVLNKIHPGEAMDKNLYDLPPEELENIPTVATSLDEALTELENDYDFLLRGDVFTKDMIDAYIELKREEVQKLNMTTHPVEFQMYYSL